ncbi:hypothetical protein ACWD5R_05015 [Streptomyces sp. NPDC002514]|uniref:hypothetical protein n=1 Tax=Streptomyces sp. NPDC001270 TaxID=3364554 RepID=UPI00369915D0
MDNRPSKGASDDYLRLNQGTGRPSYNYSQSTQQPEESVRSNSSGQQSPPAYESPTPFYPGNFRDARSDTAYGYPSALDRAETQIPEDSIDRGFAARRYHSDDANHPQFGIPADQAWLNRGMTGSPTAMSPGWATPPPANQDVARALRDSQPFQRPVTADRRAHSDQPQGHQNRKATQHKPKTR